MLADSNVLIFAFRKDAVRHGEYKSWLETALSREPAIGYSDFVFSSFIRIVTHPRIYAKPSSPDEAFSFAEAIRGLPNAVRITPQSGHWAIFRRLCREAGAKGGLVPDAYLAALAIEAGCEWITADRDFARFPGLKWRHPLVA